MVRRLLLVIRKPLLKIWKWGNMPRPSGRGNHDGKLHLHTVNFLAFDGPLPSLDYIPPRDELGRPYRRVMSSVGPTADRGGPRSKK